MYFLDSSVTFCLLDLQISQHAAVKQPAFTFRVRIQIMFYALPMNDNYGGCAQIEIDKFVSIVSISMTYIPTVNVMNVNN
jgi:hypothetical protein